MARTLLSVMEEDVEVERAVIREPLKLNIYDVTCFNKCLYRLGLGIYHSAVEAYGSEYAYGAHEYPTSGVFEVKPRHCPGFRFRRSLMLGTVWMGQEKFREFVEKITAEYTGDSYSLLFKNCNHFCDDVCVQLVNIRIPRWVNRLSKIGMLFSCFLPRSLNTDGIHTCNVDANDTESTQDEIRKLASSFAVVPSKRKHCMSVSALLRSSQARVPLRQWKVHDISKKLTEERFKEL